MKTLSLIIRTIKLFSFIYSVSSDSWVIKATVYNIKSVLKRVCHEFFVLYVFSWFLNIFELGFDEIVEFLKNLTVCIPTAESNCTPRSQNRKFYGSLAAHRGSILIKSFYWWSYMDEQMRSIKCGGWLSLKCSTFMIEYFGEIETEFENILTCLSGAKMGSYLEKRAKISWHTPFSQCSPSLSRLFPALLLPPQAGQHSHLLHGAVRGHQVQADPVLS